MSANNRYQMSLDQEAKFGLNSLLKQTAQVGIGFLAMLLLTGGNPPALTMMLSCAAGISFVTWSEQKRLTKQRIITEMPIPREEIQEQVKQLLQADTENLSELVKTAGLNPLEDFVGANLVGVKGVGCNFSGFNLNGVQLGEADLSRANLSDANLSHANLRSANLSRAYLVGANLYNALLIDADLSHADMRNANLSNADLIHVDLRGTDLRGANLTQTNLSSAIVVNAQFGANPGLTEDTKSDLKQRGAIFPQDEPAPARL
ncbi:MAG: pentapeptide repeat-containing protein [Mojavia pulchra JT2-VF2]|jgi:hypothetical protein|uniref:Pentapeptide repeat-containing protein n=1 Tax=Mojavia pulchra JT2-VF2 TaxID=287848 RepID=A0A951Q1H3_9NOST|nr:pentapeptide repeat-containing protein [Mojavia pulchra JT2-VF2]